MEAMSANTALGSNTLNNFSHGNNYSVTNHATAGDIFSVENANKYYSDSRRLVRNGASTGNGITPSVSIANGSLKIFDPNEDTNSIDENPEERRNI